MTNSMATIITTERLTLREFADEDLDFLAALMSDPEVMQYYPKLATRDEAATWIRFQHERYARDGHGIWLTSLRATGEPIGRVGLALQEVDGVWEPEIGYMTARVYWRLGYAAEAALGVKRFAAEELRLARVISLVRPENIPSRGVAAKLGMRVEKETQFKGFLHLVHAVVLGTD